MGGTERPDGGILGAVIVSRVSAAGRLPAAAALVAATAVWGSTFVVTKQSLPDMSAAPFLTWRFGIAAAVLLVARPDRVRALTQTDRRRGLLLGLLLGSGFLLQTEGLQDTAAGVSGFLTGTAVMLTPVAAAVFFAERVGRAGWVAVALSAVGVALLAGGGSATVTTGALLTLGGAVCFTGHITGLSQWASSANAYGLTAWSVAVAALLCGATAAVGGGLSLPPSGGAWRSLAYLALAATCLGFVVQAWAQSALTATTAAVVMTMEPVFAALIAATVGDERLPTVGWLGGMLIVSSMFVAELGPRECCDALAPRVECC
jgi:drug/metabolite transporter (DMT)-like permease